MQKTTTFELITALNSEQQREFRIWLDSPFFNTQKEVVSLYDFLLRSITISKKSKLNEYFEEANVWKAIYPKEIFEVNNKNQATRIRGLLFKISENVKKYLIYNGLEENKTLQHELLHQQLLATKLNNATAKNLKDWSIALKEKPKNDYFFLQEKALFLSKKVDFEVASSNDTRLIPEWCDAEILSQSNTILQLYIQLLFDKKSKYDTAFFDEYITILEKKIIEKPITLQLQLLSIKMSKNVENGDIIAIYKALKQLFQANQPKISEKLSNTLVLSLSNVATILLNSGQEFFIREALEWNLEKIKRKQHFEKGFLTTTTFKNTLRLGFNLIFYKKEKLSHWSSVQFIQESVLLLQPDLQETYKDFAEGYLDFLKENYEEALPKLKSFKPNVAIHQLDAMRIVLAIYYKLENDENFERQITKINTFLTKENVFNQNIVVFNQNFIFFLEEIKKLDSDKKAKKELFEKMKSEKNIADKEWLLSIL